MSSSFSNSVSAEIQVLPVNDSSLRKQFVKLAWTLNQNDPNWVPPLIQEVKTLLNPQKHPFYEFGSAQPFLAFKGGKPVGRILAADDPKTNSRKGTNHGTWGMFECINDVRVAKALLNAAFDWCKNQAGREKILGPMTFSTNYDIGLLTKGFETPPTLGMCHNPPYYEQLVKDAGAVECQGLYAWWFNICDELILKWKKRIEWFQKRSSVTLRVFNPRDFKQEIKLCREVYNASMRDNWNYAELSQREIEKFAHEMIQNADTDHIFLAFDGEKPVGFSVTMPDLNQAIRHLNGRLFPFGFLKYLYYRRKIHTARVMILCVNPEYRRRGITELLIYKTIEHGFKIHVTGGELGWTYRDNQAINSVIERCGGFPYKEYGLYEYTK